MKECEHYIILSNLKPYEINCTDEVLANRGEIPPPVYAHFLRTTFMIYNLR